MTTANIYGVDNGYCADTWPAHATAQERANWQFLGGGYAIEWPDLDEHIGMEGLLAGRSSGEREGSLQKWLAGRVSR